jgi:hypothetical protein
MEAGIVGGEGRFMFDFILKLLIAVVLLLVSHSLNFMLTGAFGRRTVTAQTCWSFPDTSEWSGLVTNIIR